MSVGGKKRKLLDMDEKGDSENQENQAPPKKVKQSKNYVEHKKIPDNASTEMKKKDKSLFQQSYDDIAPAFKKKWAKRVPIPLYTAKKCSFCNPESDLYRITECEWAKKYGRCFTCQRILGSNYDNNQPEHVTDVESSARSGTLKKLITVDNATRYSVPSSDPTTRVDLRVIDSWRAMSLRKTAELVHDMTHCGSEDFCVKHDCDPMCDECSGRAMYELGWWPPCWMFGGEPEICIAEIEELHMATRNPPLKTGLQYFLRDVISPWPEDPVVYLYSKRLLNTIKHQTELLCIDKTLRLGPCYVTMFSFRQCSLVQKSSQKKIPPLMLGPVMIHFVKDAETYKKFFKTIKEAAGIESNPMTADKINNMKGVAKSDRALVGAMREVFGSAVSLPGLKNNLTSARKKLQLQVKCKDTLPYVAERINYFLAKQRDSVEEALFAKTSSSQEYRLHDWAKKHMEGFSKDDPVAYMDEFDSLDLNVWSRYM